MTYKTYIISLPIRLTDRLIPLIDHLKSFDFEYWVVSAEKNNDGRLGLIKTIQKLFTELLKSEYENFLILEDDMRFVVDNPKKEIKKCLSQAPKTFDMIFLGCNLWQNHVYKFSDSLIKLSDGYALHSVIYSKQAINKVLKAIEDMQGVIPLDVLIKEKIMVDNLCFCSFPMLATQIASHSDIENKSVDYFNILDKRFLEKTKHLK